MHRLTTSSHLPSIDTVELATFLRPPDRPFYLSIIAVSLALGLGGSTRAQSCTECIDFDNQTTAGFAACPGNAVLVQNNQFGPSNSPTDYYLHIDDLPGQSWVCGPAPCPGDWSQLGPCGALCFDYRVIEDDAPSGWLDIHPRIRIFSGSVNGLRAAFVATSAVTDDAGPNGGWHHFCAPLGPLDANLNPPSNEYGEWIVEGGNSNWPIIMANVTGILLVNDWVSSQGEVVGYDNICLRDDVCPPHSGVNKDLTNDTGLVANGVDILIEGNWTSNDLLSVFNGIFTVFDIVQVGPNTLLRWTGNVDVPPAAVRHVGYSIWAPETTVLGVFWTYNLLPIGCAPQCNVGRATHTVGTGLITYMNNCNSCAAEPLYSGDLALEYYVDPPPLADWNGTTPRMPMRIDVVTSSLHLQPGQRQDVQVPAAPAGAKFALLVFEVGTDPLLAGPNTTVDFLLVPVIDALEYIGTVYCSPGVPNSTGLPGSLLASGSEVVVENDVTMHAFDLPHGSFGYFIVSATRALVVNPSGSNGVLCVGPIVGRAPGGVFNTGTSGVGTRQVNLTALPQPNGPVVVLPGETWHFQGWYRDFGPSNNFTDAVSLTFY
jgi:hypothetical protein